MSSESSSTAIVAEKPSVARDIAKVLGASKKGEGFLHGNGYVVTWAVGHLVSLAQPHEMNPTWKQWRMDTLPMLPSAWPLVVYEKTRDQFEVVRKILNSPRVGLVVCATDAGREGELIFRYIYAAAECDKPVQRLWISSMTAEAIKKGFDSLLPSERYDGLADAAHGRSRADWLVGMNLSRAYSLHYNEDLSVGRVQTPTLAMIVERELALRAFNAEEYVEVHAVFQGIGERSKEAYQGVWFRPRAEQTEGGDKETLAQLQRLPADGDEAKQIVLRARTGAVSIESLKSETQRSQPPLLYDLTELQRHANQLYSYSAQETLTYAQNLYERHKLISYPRTDSRHLSADMAATLGRVAQTVAPQYPGLVADGTGQRPLGKRFVDDSKVSDHHALLPNAVNPGKAALSEQERKIYDLVCRRFLTMWHDDHLKAVTTVVTAIANPGGDVTAEPTIDRFRTSGTLVQQIGWKALDLAPEKKKKGGKKSEADDDDAEQVLPTDLAQGQPQTVGSIDAKKKKTKPPKRFTEGTLLTAMQTAGQTLDEKELSDAMKETGLGTPATRAGIIETLLKRAYIVRSGKTLEATDKGIHLIEAVHPEVKSPAMTGQWEAFLKKIHHGQAQLPPFLDGINQYVSEVVGKVRTSPRRRFAAPAARASEPATAPDKAPDKPSAKKPTAAQLAKLLEQHFGYAKLLPGQKEACAAILAGKDYLLALPPGTGKSLCAQLAALALGGTAIIFSPQTAWMDERVARLRERQIPAESIHAGREREALRSACVDYLSGRLGFLYVAPERLTVPGFVPMLAKRKPCLVIVEEAQRAIPSSQDHLADYSLLAGALAALRPAPILALTPELAPELHQQIAALLGLKL